MAAEIISKQCSKCKTIKPISEFYKQKTCKDGHKPDCKVCYLKHSRKYFKTEQGKATKKRYDQSEKGKTTHKRHLKTEKGKATKRKINLRHQQTEKYKISHNRSAIRYNIRHPKQSKAKRAVEKAIRDGQLPRPDSLQCHYCPAQAKEYHHHKGYAPEHWLDVVPICIKCHNKIPKKQVISATV